MAKAKPVGGGLVCYDSEYNYFQLGICGYLLMYRQKRFKDGRRCFMLTDALAKALHFEGLFELKFYLSTIQFWRGFVSVERLKIAFAKYDEKWGSDNII
ncbi:MAG: hypothetical protein K5764_01610 [Prevotella sp.]|nr:hypothetical protein [Prevotella sp.]